MKKIKLASHHPIVDIRKNAFFANNGNIVLCYKADLPEIYSLSSTDFEDLHGAWFQAIKSLPVGTVVHKQDVYLKKSFTSEKLPNDTFLAKATSKHFNGREYMEHQCYLFFILPKNKALNNPKYVNPFKKVAKSVPKEMDDNLNRFINAVNDSVSFINNSRKILLTPLISTEILGLTHLYFNGFNEGYDTDILLNPTRRGGITNVNIGENNFDVLAINSELCFGENVLSSKTNERFTSDDFVFHQGFIDGYRPDLERKPYRQPDPLSGR